MTVEQLSLDSAPVVPRVPDRPRTPQQKWDAFIDQHPWALDEIVRVTRELLDSGVRATIAVVWEELRYRFRTDGAPYRWDNSLRAPCAAQLRDEFPDVATHMRTRKDRR